MVKHVVVVGSGVGGLATAWALRQKDPGVAVTVCEAGPSLGGVTKTERRDGWVLEEGPDSLITIKPAGMALLRELGLGEQAHGTQPNARQAFVVRRGKLVPVPAGLYLMAPAKLWPFAMSGLVSWRAKLRMGLDLVLPRRSAEQPEESLGQFVRRRLGREALARIAQPMVGGIYTADPERLSVAATMPQFLDMEREHRSLILAMRARARQQASQASASGPRYGLFASLPGGLQDIVDALVKQLPDVTFRTDAPVTQIIPPAPAHTATQEASLAAGVRLTEDSRWSVLTGGQTLSADAVVIATPAHASAKLLNQVDLELAKQLASIPYAGVATVNLGYRAEHIDRLPQGAGFVVPSCEHRCILACTISSTKYPDRAPDGYVLLRAFIGGGLHEGDLERSDQELIQAAHAELSDLLGINGEPMLTHLRRWPQAMAQYVVGHREKVADIRERESVWPGLALVGNGYEGVGLPDVIAQARQAVERIAPCL